jgi:hypothetical protein
MPTNLLIGYADIPNAAESITLSRTASGTYPYENLFGGNRTDLFYLNAAASGDTLATVDLGASATKATNFIYIGRANLLQQASVGTITLKGSSTNNYGAATTVRTLSSFGSQTLYGPNNDEFIDSFTLSSAFRYWFINYNSTASGQLPHAKFFFGTAFDPGRDPNAPATITRVKMGGSQIRPSYSFEITWEGLTYAKAIEMYLKFYRTRRFVPLVIFTTSWHDILMGHRVLFCRLTEMSMPPRVTDFCDVSATFEEMP